MTDVNEMIVEPLVKFIKDSSYLVKKCTKPDHKGMFSSQNADFGFVTFVVLLRRICKDCSCYWVRIFNDGFHRIFCQACAHSNQ